MADIFNGRETESAFHWIVDLLERLDIPYQITGGFAARLYGADRPLNDIDFDVSEERLGDIAKHIPEEYVTYGPERYKDDTFDIELMSLEYKGQEIDLAGIGTGKLFNKEIQKWVDDSVDLNGAKTMEAFGRSVKVVPKQDLIDYKNLIGRPMDLEDIRLLTA